MDLALRELQAEERGAGIDQASWAQKVLKTIVLGPFWQQFGHQPLLPTGCGA